MPGRRSGRLDASYDVQTTAFIRALLCYKLLVYFREEDHWRQRQERQLVSAARPHEAAAAAVAMQGPAPGAVRITDAMKRLHVTAGKPSIAAVNEFAERVSAVATWAGLAARRARRRGGRGSSCGSPCFLSIDSSRSRKDAAWQGGDGCRQRPMRRL